MEIDTCSPAAIPVHSLRCSCPPESSRVVLLLYVHLSGLRCLCSLIRAPEAFVSIQLEKVGLRDVMLNAFLLRKQTMADRMKSLVSTVIRAP